MVTLHEAPNGLNPIQPPENWHVFQGTPSRGRRWMGSFDDFSGSQKRGDLKVQPFMFMGCKDLSTDQ